MTEEFDAILTRLRLHSGKSGYAGLRVEAAEARVLVAALDTWREALIAIADSYQHDHCHDIPLVVADALGVSVAELERLVAE